MVAYVCLCTPCDAYATRVVRRRAYVVPMVARETGGRAVRELGEDGEEVDGDECGSCYACKKYGLGCS
jgi:hypothetical protein